MGAFNPQAASSIHTLFNLEGDAMARYGFTEPPLAIPDDDVEGPRYVERAEWLSRFGILDVKPAGYTETPQDTAINN